MTLLPFAGLPLHGYDFIMADPPWPFTHYSKKGEGKSFKPHYKQMSLEAIKALPVAVLAQPDCMLWLWATGSRLDQAVEVMRLWGFQFKTEIIWRKVSRSGKALLGPGYVARTMHEPVLIGTVGEPTLLRPFPSLFDGVRREHSRKPEEAFELIDECVGSAMKFGHRKLELFAREARPGWENWGDQTSKFNAGKSRGRP